MDRRSLIAVAVCFLILLFYPYFLQWVSPPAKEQSIPPTAPNVISQDVLNKQVNDVVMPPLSTERPEQLLPKYDAPEEEFVVENDQARIVLSSWSASIKEIGLKYFHDKKGQTVRLGAGEKDGWKSLSLLLSRQGKTQWASEGAYRGGIQGKRVIFESIQQEPLTIRKTYLFEESGYRIRANVEIVNKSAEDMAFDQGMAVAVGSIFGHDVKEGLADISAAGLDNLGNVWRKNVSKVKENIVERGSFQWVGLQNQYYAIILKPQTESQGLMLSPIFDIAAKSEGLSAAASIGSFKISAGQSLSQDFLIYAGPKEYFQMEKSPEKFQKIMDFGWFDSIARGILYLLHVMYRPFHNYGIAIILLTVLVKVLTYPLTAVSFKSMKRMQELQPHLTALKEKHKDNPQKMQKEMMALYKEHKVNPMGGCLPMLIQLPIFVALFNALRNAIELKGSSFLWIHDLSLPDTVAVIAGLPINILPIIMGGTMVWQQKLSPMDPAQAKMMTFMPIFFTFIFYSFPSGLVLYWLVNNVLSIAQQYQVQRRK